MPKPNRPHLQQVSNTASIVFDSNAPIITEPWINTIDKQKPNSQVLPLPAIITDTTFYISLSGTDLHSGIHDYDIYVTVNDTATYLLIHDLKYDSLRVKGKYDNTYKFWSIARDRAGNLEDAPSQPDAVVTLQQPVGIQDVEANTISIVPNPATDLTSIEFAQELNDNTQLTITNTTGTVLNKKIMLKGTRKYMIDVSNFPTGIYLFSIEFLHDRAVKKNSKTLS
jgi:hypothetical protein